MRKLSLSVSVALLTFAIGVFATRVAGRLSTPLPNVSPVAVTSSKPEIPLQPVVNDSESTESEQTVKPHLVSISPYEIKRMVESDALAPCERNGYSGYVDFGPIWYELSFPTKEDDDSIPKRCNEPAKVTIYNYALDNESDAETVVQLTFGIYEGVVYLVFKQADRTQNGEWTLVGYIPYAIGPPFTPPTHRVLSDGQHRWLAIKYIGGHGSGYGLNFEDLYAVTGNGITRVLTYQTGLFLGFANPGIDSTTKILHIGRKNGVVHLSLRFTNRFASYSARDSLHLWTTKRRVTYLRRVDSQEFMLDTQTSEMSEKELDDLSGYDERGDYLKNILKYNYPELAIIANGRDLKRKEWLRNFLGSYDDSAEKRLLSRALELSR